jgi:hypothetical protein
VSLNAWGEQGTGAAVESYVNWVLAAGGDHEARFESLRQRTPEATYDAAYHSLDVVRQFGRTARFDYLTMLGRLRFLDIRAPHAYLSSATGPLTGTKLLFHGDKHAAVSTREVAQQLIDLSRVTGIGPDVLEDAICNWQKNPDRYVRFAA